MHNYGFWIIHLGLSFVGFEIVSENINCRTFRLHNSVPDEAEIRSINLTLEIIGATDFSCIRQCIKVPGCNAVLISNNGHCIGWKQIFQAASMIFYSGYSVNSYLYFEDSLATCGAFGYIKVPEEGFCFKVEWKQTKHTEAKQACTSQGGNLIQLNSQRKTDVVSSYVQNTAFTPPYLFIDGNDFEQSRQFRWSDGTLMDTFGNWMPAEPNMETEHCVAAMLPSMKWIDVNCLFNLPYICEISTVYDPIPTQVINV